jgi:hypothetical protein
LIYEGDPKVAVFDSRPSALARYARSGDGWSNSVYSFYRRSRTIGTIPYVYYMPPQLEHFLALTPRAVAFMHLRVSPSGNQRLVIVTAEAGSGVYVLVIEPTTLTATSHPHFGVLGPYGKAGMQYLSTLGVAVFNGQFDRLHSDHFTIPYQVGDVNFVVDGWLQNDDSIRMVDSGLTPTSQPSPASAH